LPVGKFELAQRDCLLLLAVRLAVRSGLIQQRVLLLTLITVRLRIVPSEQLRQTRQIHQRSLLLPRIVKDLIVPSTPHHRMIDPMKQVENFERTVLLLLVALVSL
jgi:hypothetical protein